MEHQLHDFGVHEVFRDCLQSLVFSVNFLRFVPMNKTADEEAKQRTLAAQTKGSIRGGLETPDEQWDHHTRRSSCADVHTPGSFSHANLRDVSGDIRC